MLKIKLKQKGFTLIELIVVIAIIGILAMTLVPSMLGYVRKSKRTSDISNAREIYQEAEMILIEKPEYLQSFFDMNTTASSRYDRLNWKAKDPETGKEYGVVAVARMAGRQGITGDDRTEFPYKWGKVDNEAKAFCDALNKAMHITEEDANKNKLVAPMKLGVKDYAGNRADAWTIVLRVDTWDLEVWASCSKLRWNSTTKGPLMYRVYPSTDPAYS